MGLYHATSNYIWEPCTADSFDDLWNLVGSSAIVVFGLQKVMADSGIGDSEGILGTDFLRFGCSVNKYDFLLEGGILPDSNRFPSWLRKMDTMPAVLGITDEVGIELDGVKYRHVRDYQNRMIIFTPEIDYSKLKFYKGNPPKQDLWERLKHLV